LAATNVAPRNVLLAKSASIVPPSCDFSSDQTVPTCIKVFIYATGETEPFFQISCS
jgi:hypothetical protein